MALEEDPQLGCGRSINRLWDALDTPPDAHEQQCPQCQRARAQLQRVKEATAAFRQQGHDDPTLRPGGQIKDAILSVARAEVRRTKKIVLARTEGGATDISEQALLGLVRLVARDTAGVQSRRCFFELSDSGSHLTVHLRVAVLAGISIPAAAHLLRLGIITAMQTAVGVDPAAINIKVEDLYDV